MYGKFMAMHWVARRAIIATVFFSIMIVDIKCFPTCTITIWVWAISSAGWLLAIGLGRPTFIILRLLIRVALLSRYG
ncbi:hypothetical protein AWB68_02409 [Caballeronia choica]|uniref:Uncharacterized protein n=1 Tax=Caballeronia choica TaxID=326476 RepID=A0A158HYA8_9BURK|nr:hypothetical protein AWB68_02409 [Caballeronia choica]